MNVCGCCCFAQKGAAAFSNILPKSAERQKCSNKNIRILFIIPIFCYYLSINRKDGGVRMETGQEWLDRVWDSMKIKMKAQCLRV